MLTRRLRLWWHRFSRTTTLSQRFLAVAMVTVAVSTIGIGLLAGRIVQTNVLEGVAETANSSIEALIYPSVKDLAAERDLTAVEIEALDTVFATTMENSSTRLIQFSLLRLDGKQIYLADGGIPSIVTEDLLDKARLGRLTASLETVIPDPVGPFAGFSLTVLRIVTPLSGPDGSPLLVAVLYLGARDLNELTLRTQQQIWVTVLVAGGLVLAALYFMVDRASSTISTQRLRLARNLSASRSLADENSRLREASETLRLEASRMNETLLGQVGSDIHDGPVQLLTLLILKLSRTGAGSGPGEPASIAQQAMEELRNISTGLVLPELSQLTLQDTIRLASARHERVTDVPVTTELDPGPVIPPMAVKICTYRVIQESLNNGFRHGGGRPAVKMNLLGDHVDVSVSVELPLEPQERSSSGERLGLLGMKLRVESLGGTIDINFDSGSVVRFRLPLSLPDIQTRQDPPSVSIPSRDDVH